MSGQLSLDAMGGIDWEHPRLEQLEQFAIDYLSGCTTRWEIHNSFMCVAVEQGAVTAWMRPSLERDVDDNLVWLVRIELEDGASYVAFSDKGLKAALRYFYDPFISFA